MAANCPYGTTLQVFHGKRTRMLYNKVSDSGKSSYPVCEGKRGTADGMRKREELSVIHTVFL